MNIIIIFKIINLPTTQCLYQLRYEAFVPYIPLKFVPGFDRDFGIFLSIGRTKCLPFSAE